jgi:DNA repair protein RecO (recombination protein O)
MASRTYAAEGIVLKRSNLGEADRLVTLFSENRGKIVAIAKGARRLNSNRAAALEPATQAQFFFAVGKSLDILTQAQIINSFPHARENLTRMTQTYQILEVVDLLTVENQEHPDIYALLLSTLQTLETDGPVKEILVENIRQILKVLGFTYDKVFSETKLKEYIEELASKRLHTKDFLNTLGRKSS